MSICSSGPLQVIRRLPSAVQMRVTVMIRVFTIGITSTGETPSSTMVFWIVFRHSSMLAGRLIVGRAVEDAAGGDGGAVYTLGAGSLS